MSSEQVATVLRQAGSHVRLIVARSAQEPTPDPTGLAPIVPTSQLDDHLEQINQLMAEGLLGDSDEQLDFNLTQENMEAMQLVGLQPYMEHVQVHQVRVSTSKVEWSLWPCMWSIYVVKLS